MKNNFVGNEVVETPPFEPNSNVQPLHQSPNLQKEKLLRFTTVRFKHFSIMLHKQFINHFTLYHYDLFNFVAVVGLAPLHDGYEPCMRLSHFYRDIKKATSFHNVLPYKTIILIDLNK